MIDRKQKIILVTGAAGQLGSELREAAARYPGYSFLFTDRKQLDIANESAVNNFFDSHAIDYCINCAAYTAVDKAEQEKDAALLINAAGAGNIARVCKKHGVQLFHISTDYVFNGRAEQPYRPEDQTDPINLYGFSKREGENKILAENHESLIIRTSWLYSSFGNNFVKTMLRLMKERESISVVNDQWGSPTYAADLADAVLKIIESEKMLPGIYHFANTGATNWFQFAKKIASVSGGKCVINPIPTSQYPTPAARPHYSVLATQKITDVFGLQIPAWEESLQSCLALISKE